MLLPGFVQLSDDVRMNEADIKAGMKRKGFKYNKDLSGMGNYKDPSGNDKAYKGGFDGVQFAPLDLTKDSTTG